MRRVHTHIAAVGEFHLDDRGTVRDHARRRPLACAHCEHPLECVEQNRRLGTWLGSFMCPNCRSEYFYAYRWGRLLPKA